jgi:curved DNA-binding protein CbpA
MKADLYDALGVKRDARTEDIRRAYRKVAKKAHPDGGGSIESFALVRQALDTLGDDARRAHYDQTGEIDEKPVDTKEAVALQIVINVIDRVLNECVKQGRPPESCDVIESAMLNLKNDLKAMPGRLAEMRIGAAMMRKLAKRFRGKKKAENRIGPLFEQRAVQCERDERILAQEKENIERALAIL